MFPNDRQILTIRLYLLAVLKWSSGTTPSLELATRLIRPFAVMFSRSLGLKNTRPKVLPDTDTQHVHVPAQLATLPLHGSQFEQKGYKSCAAC
jgi:hypothetical protein